MAQARLLKYLNKSSKPSSLLRAGLVYVHSMSEKNVTTQVKDDDAKIRIRLKIRAYDHKIIDQSTRKIIEAAQRSGAEIAGPVPLPTEKKKFTVLKSTFVHKNSRDQFEMRIHKRLIDIFNPTPQTVDDLMKLNLPAGVDVEIKM